MSLNLSPGSDPEFPVKRGAGPRGTNIRISQIFRKTAWNWEKILGRRGLWGPLRSTSSSLDYLGYEALSSTNSNLTHWYKEVPITFFILSFSASGCKTDCVLIPSIKARTRCIICITQNQGLRQRFIRFAEEIFVDSYIGIYCSNYIIHKNQVLL